MHMTFLATNRIETSKSRLHLLDYKEWNSLTGIIMAVWGSDDSIEFDQGCVCPANALQFWAKIFKFGVLGVRVLDLDPSVLRPEVHLTTSYFTGPKHFPSFSTTRACAVHTPNIEPRTLKSRRFLDAMRVAKEKLSAKEILNQYRKFSLAAFKGLSEEHQLWHGSQLLSIQVHSC